MITNRKERLKCTRCDFPAVKILALAVMGLSLAGAGANVGAQRYPTKPIRLIVPLAPGGGMDIMARTIVAKIAEPLKQQVVVENRPGAGNTIASEFVAKSPPDGYTLLMVGIAHSVNPSFYRKLPYDTERDFAPIAFLGASPNILVVHPSLPVKSVPELIKLAKTAPGKINYASAGNGSSPHLAAELFKYLANVDLQHIPYKGSGPALTDLLGGQVAVMFGSLLPTLPHVKSGRLVALATTGEKRSDIAPDLPTVAESGVAGYAAETWFGIVAPAGTDRQVVTRINAEINGILAESDVRKRLQHEGVTPGGGPPVRFEKFISEQIKRWAVVVAKTGLKAD